MMRSLLISFLTVLSVTSAARTRAGVASFIEFPKSPDGSYGLRIKERGQLGVEQATPVHLQIVSASGEAVVKRGYDRVATLSALAWLATADVTTSAGSKFHVVDRFRLPGDGTSSVTVNRTVQVIATTPAETAFSSTFSVEPSSAGALAEYDVFMPAIWYKQNADAPAAGLASHMDDTNFWIREDRLPLPLVMIFDRRNGFTFSIFHTEQDSQTFGLEHGLSRITDARMKFGSLGLVNVVKPVVGFQFPGSEGERTGIDGMLDQKRWALRSHPLVVGFEQHYVLKMEVRNEPNFESAVHATWMSSLSFQDPPIYRVDLKQIYDDQISVMKRYWNQTGGVPGLPFAIRVDGIATDESRDMGFVGQQIANASLMIREGIASHDDVLRSEGESTVDW